MKLYRKIIHPYTELNGEKCSIPNYKGRWFFEESKQKIMDDIYNTYKKKEETKVAFFKRYILKWQIKYEEVSFVTSLDDKIENLK